MPGRILSRGRRTNLDDHEGEHPAGDRGQMILLMVFLVVWLADSFLLRFSTFLSESIPLIVRLVILAVALLVSIWLMRSGHVVTREEQRPARVISTGAFRYVRHPLYLASILFYLGLTVATASVISLGGFVIIFIFYNYIASFEEKIMLERFGDKYRDYMKTAGKWLPRFGGRS